VAEHETRSDLTAMLGATLVRKNLEGDRLDIPQHRQS
jgi:hypothetical protein